jgi:hypothetical protein
MIGAYLGLGRRRKISVPRLSVFLKGHVVERDRGCHMRQSSSLVMISKPSGVQVGYRWDRVCGVLGVGDLLITCYITELNTKQINWLNRRAKVLDEILFVYSLTA